MKKITILAALLFAVFSMSSQVTVFEDGFETYDDFAFDPITGYTQIDNDGDTTYGSATYDFTNSGYTGTAIIFNPAMTTPPAIGTAWDVRTGDKGLYFFASTGSVSGTPLNDDYFITPQIDLSSATGGSDFSFWAKSLTADFGLERFEVLLSTTGTAEGDFTNDLSGGEEMAPVDVYTEFSYDLSAYEGEQVYLAIHYVAQDSFVLQMDDFLVTTAILNVSDNAFNSFNYFVDSRSQLNLKANTPMQNVKLYNVLGQQVVSQKLANSSETINISTLNLGVYIAMVTIDGQNKSFKIVKK